MDIVESLLEVEEMLNDKEGEGVFVGGGAYAGQGCGAVGAEGGEAVRDVLKVVMGLPPAMGRRAEFLRLMDMLLECR